MLVSTKDTLVRAQKEHHVVVNSCIWSVEMLSGVMKTFEELQSPVTLSLGSGFLVNMDINHFVNMIRSYTTQTSFPCFIYWDYGRSFEIVSYAIDIGYNSLMIDGSAYSFEEDIRMTREVVDKFHPMCIPVEAELDHVGAETGYEEVLNHHMYTDLSQAVEFVEKANIDSLAVAIGNQHGAYTAPPQTNFEILEKARRNVSIPLVLHDASGIGGGDIRHAISPGITKINIHTKLCEAAMSAIQVYEKGEGYQALNIRVKDVVQKQAEEKTPLSGSSGKAEGWFEK